MTTTPPTGPRLARVGKFGAVGIINTALDFAIFNVLSATFGWPVLLANAVSTTIAMVFSFLANRHVVFKAGDASAGRQAVLFLVVTGFGLYVLQLGTIKLLIDVWTTPLTLAVSVARNIGLHSLSESFIRNNTAKAVGTVISLIWNYIMYKRVVFAQ